MARVYRRCSTTAYLLVHTHFKWTPRTTRAVTRVIFSKDRSVLMFVSFCTHNELVPNHQWGWAGRLIAAWNWYWLKRSYYVLLSSLQCSEDFLYKYYYPKYFPWTGTGTFHSNDGGVLISAARQLEFKPNNWSWGLNSKDCPFKAAACREEKKTIITCAYFPGSTGRT